MNVDLGTAIGYLMLDTSGFQKGFDSAFKDMESFLDKTNKMNDKLKAFGSATTKVGTAATKYLTLPLISAGTAFTAFAASSESALSRFSAKAGIATEDAKEYEGVLQSIYKNNYGESYEDIADAMGEVAVALGEMDPSNMQEVTESALALRDVYGYEVPESLRTVNTLMKNFGVTSEQAFDYIVKGQQKGLDFSGEFLDTLNEYSVQFGKLGLDIDDMFSILETGAEGGAFNLDKVGDAVKEFSIRIIDGSDTTTHALETLGYDVDDTMAAFAEGGEGARDLFFEMITQLSYMDDEVQKNLVGTELFGTMWEDLGPEVVKQLADMTSGAFEAEGAMNELKEVKYDNLKSAMEGLGRSIQVAGASLGKYFIPFVQSAIDLVQGWTDKFNSLSESSKQMVVIIGTIVAAIGPILLIVGKLITGISSLMTAMSTLSGLSAILAPVGTVLSGFVAPIVAILAAIGVLVVAWQTDFNGMRETVSSVFESIQSIVSSVMTIVQSVVTTVLGIVVSLWQNNFANMQGIVTAAFNTIQSTLENAFTVIEDIFAIFANLFTGNWSGLWESVKKLLNDQWVLITSLLGNFLNLIIQLIVGIVGGVYEAMASVAKAASDAFESGFNALLNWFKGVIDDPVGTVLGIKDAMFNAGEEVLKSMLDGLKSMWEGLTSWVSEAVDWLVDKVTFWETESSKINTGTVRGGPGIQGSFASGLDYVPRDMNVRVHEGEAILTKEENKNRSGSGTVTIEVPLYINGKKVARAIAKDVDVELGKRKG